MKKIAFFAFLLTVCASVGRAQESRQDISLSGTGIYEPFRASSTDVQVATNVGEGAMVSYRFMLTPSSALEANYGITYHNTMHYLISNTNTYLINTRTQEISFAYVRSFNFRKWNPFVEAGPGVLIFLPIRDETTQTLDAKQQTGVSTARESHTRSAPASIFAPSTAVLSPRFPPSGSASSTPSAGTTSLFRLSASPTTSNSTSLKLKGDEFALIPLLVCSRLRRRSNDAPPGTGPVL
jgi:outer membrane immunogenic protein